MAFEHLVDAANICLEFHEIGAAMIGERHFGEDGYGLGQLCEIEPGPVADDIARSLEPLDALQAGARRKADRVGELDIGDAADRLKLDEYVDVDAIQLRIDAHPRSL